MRTITDRPAPNRSPTIPSGLRSRSNKETKQRRLIMAKHTTLDEAVEDRELYAVFLSTACVRYAQQNPSSRCFIRRLLTLLELA